MSEKDSALYVSANGYGTIGAEKLIARQKETLFRGLFNRSMDLTGYPYLKRREDEEGISIVQFSDGGTIDIAEAWITTPHRRDRIKELEREALKQKRGSRAYKLYNKEVKNLEDPTYESTVGVALVLTKDHFEENEGSLLYEVVNTIAGIAGGKLCYENCEEEDGELFISLIYIFETD